MKEAQYELWKFFKDEHDLTLTAGELDDIVHAVDVFNDAVNHPPMGIKPMKIEPFKMRVTPEQSRRVQEVIFENGGKWRSGKTTVINTSYTCLAFDLRGDGDGISGWSDPFTSSTPFMDVEVPEIMYDEFMNKYGKQMSEIKLEVGKTYRNREGKEVRIVGFDERYVWPYHGSDGERYAESGQWRSMESPHDLVEEVPETCHAFITPDEAKKVTATRYTFKIPDGTKGINVSKEGNRLVVEMVPEKEPKPGDAAERCRIMDYLQRYANYATWNYEQLCWLIEDYLKQKEDEK